MAKLRSDSPICLKIVLAFVDFLTHVELAPGFDQFGLEIARSCLNETFNLRERTVAAGNDRPPKDALINLFGGSDHPETEKSNSQPEVGDFPVIPPPAASSVSINIPPPAASDDTTPMEQSPGASGKGAISSSSAIEELFQQFCQAVAHSGLFGVTSIGHAQTLEKVKQVFSEAMGEMESSSQQILDIRKLAEAVKLLGNKAMESKLNTEAAELYSVAIALVKDNAIYFCNRAAALILLQKYDEAIQDCHKSIEIDPNYSKAYSRLGRAYFGKNNYVDSICSGYVKALQLNPNSDIAMTNILEAGEKIKEEIQRLHSLIRESSARERGNNVRVTHEEVTLFRFQSINTLDEVPDIDISIPEILHLIHQAAPNPAADDLDEDEEMEAADDPMN